MNNIVNILLVILSVIAVLVLLPNALALGKHIRESLKKALPDRALDQRFAKYIR